MLLTRLWSPLVLRLLSRFLLRSFVSLRNDPACARIHKYFLDSGYTGNSNVERVDQTSLFDLKLGANDFLRPRFDTGKGCFLGLRLSDLC